MTPDDRSYFRKLCGVIVVLLLIGIAVQFHLAHQLSNMIRYSWTNEAGLVNSLRDETVERLALIFNSQSKHFADSNDLIVKNRASIESLADQLNTYGRDQFDPQRHTRELLRQMRQMEGRPFSWY